MDNNIANVITLKELEATWGLPLDIAKEIVNKGIAEGAIPEGHYKETDIGMLIYKDTFEAYYGAPSDGTYTMEFDIENFAGSLACSNDMYEVIEGEPDVYSEEIYSDVNTYREKVRLWSKEPFAVKLWTDAGGGDSHLDTSANPRVIYAELKKG